MFNKLTKIVNYHRLINQGDSFLRKNESGNIELMEPDINTLSQWYSNELVFASHQMDDLEKNKKISSSCKKGCFECCNQAVYINPVEFELLNHHMLKLSRKKQEVIKKKAIYICNQVKDTGIPLFFKEEISNKKQKAIKRYYFEKNLNCPLLGESGECLVYPIRPLVCLTYRSYGEKEACRSSHGPKYGHVYKYFGQKITEEMYDSYSVASEGHRLIAFALKEILGEDNE